MTTPEFDFARFPSSSRLEITRILPADQERVWQYLVDPELRKLWFCGGFTGSAPGEDFVMDFDHSRISDSEPPPEVGCGAPIKMVGKIVSFDPPNTLSYDWPGENNETARVTIQLTAEGDDTRLFLVHERLESQEFKRGASAGWHAHLDLLVDLANNRPTRDFWFHYIGLKSQYDQLHSEIA